MDANINFHFVAREISLKLVALISGREVFN